MSSKAYRIIIAVAVLVVFVGGAWYWQSREQSREQSAPVSTSEESVPAERLGAELLEKAQNPLRDELPQTNPFTGAETNPFIDVYENPFAQ